MAQKKEPPEKTVGSKPKNKMGRPLKEIDQKSFEDLCGIQCTRREVCQFFDISNELLNRWCKRTYNMTFASIFSIKRGAGTISLRRTGFQLAESNGSVYIFLAKNYLGMSDKPNEEELTDPTPVTVTIQVEDASNKD